MKDNTCPNCANSNKNGFFVQVSSFQDVRCIDCHRVIRKRSMTIQDMRGKWVRFHGRSAEYMITTIEPIGNIMSSHALGRLKFEDFKEQYEWLDDEGNWVRENK